MNRKFSKWLVLIGLIAMGVAGSAVYLKAEAQTTMQAEELIRLHVLANSASAYDQEVKLKIRDMVVDDLCQVFAGVEDKEDAARILQAYLPQLEEKCRQELSLYADYGLYAEYTKSDFPDRTYGDLFLPAGEYDVFVSCWLRERVIMVCVLYPFAVSDQWYGEFYATEPARPVKLSQNYGQI
jgi:stage II sporulation protein R